ncbi:MAG: ATPase [Acidobacteria bacterium]|nr:ATPase [Acidobacteriota bacterium]
MKRILLDGGTAYTKVYFLDEGGYQIIPTRRFKELRDDFEVELATGYNVSSYPRRVNELVALAEGGLALIDEPDFTLLDCGARDVKYVRVEGGKIVEMDWNTECGAFTGQIIELLTNYFHISLDKVPREAKRIPVTCGVLGMTKMFDLIAGGVPYEEAFSGFLKGIAHNCFLLVNRPRKLYLSGGLCENKAFIESFECSVIPLGRFVLLEGLKRCYFRKGGD